MTVFLITTLPGGSTTTGTGLTTTGRTATTGRGAIMRGATTTVLHTARFTITACALAAEAVKHNAAASGIINLLMVSLFKF